MVLFSRGGFSDKNLYMYGVVRCTYPQREALDAVTQSFLQWQAPVPFRVLCM